MSTSVLSLATRFMRKAVGLPSTTASSCATACGPATPAKSQAADSCCTPAQTSTSAADSCCSAEPLPPATVGACCMPEREAAPASASCCGDAAPTPMQRRAAERPAPDGAATFTVRAATGTDLCAVRELLAGAGLPVDDVAVQFGPQYAVAVAADGSVIGAEGMEVYGEGPDRHGLLRSAVVAESWRGRGVGDALTRDRLEWARQNALRDVHLLTTTAETYFPKFGFTVVQRAAAPAALQASSEFAEMCPSSAVTMRLVLAG